MVVHAENMDNKRCDKKINLNFVVYFEGIVLSGLLY